MWVGVRVGEGRAVELEVEVGFEVTGKGRVRG